MSLTHSGICQIAIRRQKQERHRRINPHERHDHAGQLPKTRRARDVDPEEGRAEINRALDDDRAQVPRAAGCRPRSSRTHSGRATSSRRHNQSRRHTRRYRPGRPPTPVSHSEPTVPNVEPPQFPAAAECEIPTMPGRNRRDRNTSSDAKTALAISHASGNRRQIADPERVEKRRPDEKAEIRRPDRAVPRPAAQARPRARPAGSAAGWRRAPRCFGTVDRGLSSSEGIGLVIGESQQSAQITRLLRSWRCMGLIVRRKLRGRQLVFAERFRLVSASSSVGKRRCRRR